MQFFLLRNLLLNTNSTVYSMMVRFRKLVEEKANCRQNLGFGRERKGLQAAPPGGDLLNQLP